jgi:predicted transcriptional regulator YdeE
MRSRSLAFAAVFVLPIALIAASASEIPAQTAMPKKIHHEEFSIVGIEVRTSNALEMKGEGRIGKQWQKFFQDGVQQKIANRIDSNIYAVYTDYASDRNGDYSFVIGLKVNADATVPSGMVLKKIPAGDYALIGSEKGPVEKVVPAAWQQIWTLEDKSQLGGQRAYKADFEVYDSRAKDPKSSQVDIYVGLK